MSDQPARPSPPAPPPPAPEALVRYADEFNRSRILRFFGVKVSFPSQDRVEVRLDEIRPEHRGGLGSSAVNGGIIAALFDLAIGCTPALLDPTRRNATIQLSMSFEQAVLGDSFHIEANIDRAGGSTIFSSARLIDERGTTCARCQGVVRLSKAPWSSGTSPAVD
jgi:acyl-coenzyme A thioesterase PaaI-like protein